MFETLTEIFWWFVGAFVVTIIVIIVVAVAHTIGDTKKKEAREKYLHEKYADYPNTLKKILNGELWQGETSSEVVDTLGEPVDIDEKATKKKRVRVYKYYHRGGNRYGLRITLEDDVVVGWDLKGKLG